MLVTLHFFVFLYSQFLQKSGRNQNSGYAGVKFSRHFHNGNINTRLKHVCLPAVDAGDLSVINTMCVKHALNS